MSGEGDHPSFVQPSDIAAKIWRYMDFTKFVAMLDSRALFFSRIDLLGDPFEGSTPRGNENYWKLVQEKHGTDDTIVERNKETIRGLARFSREHTFVNCWHLNDYESAAMWAIYSRDAASIAVQSRYSLLRECLPASVKIGSVRYIDYDTEAIPPRNVIDYCLHKRKSFEHEKELRALIWVLEVDSKTKEPIWEVQPGQGGILVPVDIPVLVEAVHLAPGSPPWFQQLVNNVTARFNVPLEIKLSKIADEPVL